MVREYLLKRFDAVPFVGNYILHRPVNLGFKWVLPYWAICFQAYGTAVGGTAIRMYKHLHSVAKFPFN